MVKVNDSIFVLSVKPDLSTGVMFFVEECKVSRITEEYYSEVFLIDSENVLKYQIGVPFLDQLPSINSVGLNSVFFLTSLSLLDECLDYVLEGISYLLEDRVESLEKEITNAGLTSNLYLESHDISLEAIRTESNALLFSEDIDFEEYGDLGLSYKLEFSESDFNQDYINFTIVPTTIFVPTVPQMEAELDEYPDNELYEEALSEPFKRLIRVSSYDYEDCDEEHLYAECVDYSEFLVSLENIRIHNSISFNNSTSFEWHSITGKTLTDEEIKKEVLEFLKKAIGFLKEKHSFYHNMFSFVKGKSALQLVEQKYLT